MVNFVKAGTITPNISQELRKAEADKKRLVEELDADLPQIENVEEILSDAMERYWSMAGGLERWAARDVTKARSMVKALVGGSIKLVPTEGGGLNAELQSDYGGLIELIKESPGTKGTGARKIGMVAGARNHLYLLLCAQGLPLTRPAGS